MGNFIKTLSAVVLGTVFATAADAQIVYPYTMNVDNAVRTSSSTGYATTGDTLTENNLKWYFNQGLVGGELNDVKVGTHSIRFRPNAGNNFYTAADLPLGFDVFSFSYSRSNFSGDRTPVAPVLEVSYSINQGTSWIAMDTISLDGVNALTRYTSAPKGISAPARLRVRAIAGADGKRYNIDSIHITAGSQATNIVLTNFSPSGLVHPSTDVITMTFNEDVRLGTGNITLFEAGAGSVQYNVASSQNISVVNNVVTIDDVTLQPNKSYYVRYDSAAIVGDVSGLKAPGIYDNTTWMFSTTALSLQNFEENFTNCNGTVLGVFTEASLKGTQTWFCDTYNDPNSSFNPPYATINGGTGSASFENEDYLITSVPVDLSALNVDKVTLSYAEKRRFGGNGVTRGIYYSADYAGNAATATWVAIDDNLETITSTGSFFNRTKDITTKIDVTKPVYLAFKYESVEDADTSINWSWSLDNIKLQVVEKGTSIDPLKSNDIFMDVLGIARSGEVKVRVSAVEDLNAQLTIYDISGRKVYTQAAAVKKGTQLVTINDINLNAGMYVIKLDTAKGSKVVKFIAE